MAGLNFRDESSDNNKRSLVRATSMVASNANQSSLTSFLSSWNADVIDMELVDAVSIGRMDIVRNGALSCSDRQLTELICLACYRGQLTVVEWLTLNTIVNLDEPNRKGHTPLIAACRKGHVAVVRFLIETGQVDVNRSDEITGCSPLLVACSKARWEVARWLLKLSKSHTDRSNDSVSVKMLKPLAWAQNNKYVDRIKWMLETDSQQLMLHFGSEQGSKDGRIPLMNIKNMYRQIRTSMTRYLTYIVSDVDVNQCDSKGFTALHYVISSEGIKGRTQLHAACHAEDANEIIHLINDCGAEINVQDNNGNTPLHIASQSGNCDVITLLMTLGADEMILNNDSRIPLVVAENMGHKDTLDLLDKDFFPRAALRQARKKVLKKAIRQLRIVVVLVREVETRKFKIALNKLRQQDASNIWLQNLQMRINRHRVMRLVPKSQHFSRIN